MCKFTVTDVYSIQECLEAYKVLIKWLPITCLEEMDMKEERLAVVDFLSDKCDEAISEMMEGKDGNKDR